MTQIINLYGGPGTGKSTSASYLFYLLKSEGKNAELVREYVKDWAWEGRHINHYDQFYFFGKQARRESLLYGKVDYIITDCPVMIGSYYANLYTPKTVATGIEAVTKAFYEQAASDGHIHKHVFLTRTKEYNPLGRFQTEDQAKDMDFGMRQMLEKLNIPFVECETDESALRELIA